MKVDFYATLRQIVGGKTVELDLPEGVTVHQLIEAIVQKFPALRRELLDENGCIYGHVHIIINGRDAPFMERGLETELSSEDELRIFPAVGGG